jgi:hypothetical protein
MRVSVLIVSSFSGDKKGKLIIFRDNRTTQGEVIDIIVISFCPEPVTGDKI